MNHEHEDSDSLDELATNLSDGGLLKSWILSALQYGPAIGQKGLEECLLRLEEYVRKNPGVLEAREPMDAILPDLLEDLMLVAGPLGLEDSQEMEFLLEAYQMMDLEERVAVSAKVLAREQDIPTATQPAYMAAMKALTENRWKELVDAVQARLPKEVYEETKYILE